MRIHLANKHDIGVTWHEYPYCDYKTKRRSHLTRHLATKKHKNDLKK